LEIGCADAFFTRLVQQEVGYVTAVEFDPIFIENAKERINPHWPMDCFVHDVLEHITPDTESTFLQNAFASLNKNGVAVIGIPSLESQTYASPQSKAGHGNCKSGSVFKETMEKYFENVFLFSMNDEVVHTGFSPMAHYLFAISSGLKN